MSHRTAFDANSHAKAFYTYLHCKPNGDPFYIGKGFGKRSSEFRSGRNQHHKNIVEKYGRENICVYVFPCESEAHAHVDEIQQIAQLRREGYELCNQTDGGEGFSGLKHTEEVKARISKAHKGNKYNLGRKHSPEHIARIASYSKAMWADPDFKAKMSLAHMGNKSNTGKKLSPEHCLKLSLSRTGKLNPNYGKKHSPETRRRISDAVKSKKTKKLP